MITRKSAQHLPVLEDKQAGEFDWNLLKRFLRYLKPYKGKLALMYTCALLNVASTVGIPLMLRLGIDEYIAAGDVQGLLYVGVAVVALVAVLYTSARLQGVLMMKIGYRVLYELRRDLFGHLQHLSFRFFDTQKAGQIMSRLTNDVQVLEELLRAGLDTIVVDALMLVGITVAMIWLSPPMSLILLFTVPLFALLVFVLRLRIMNAGRRIQRTLSAVNAFLNESITGIKVIRAFAREDEVSRNFRAVNDDYYQQTRSFYPLIAYFWQSVSTLNTVGTALVILAGGIFLYYGMVSLGVIAAFLSYINRFFQPMQKLSNMMNQMSRSMASAERIFNIMDVEPGVQDAPDAITNVQLQGEIEFRDVTFSYDGEEIVLRDVNLHANPGETVAIVGPTGAGKSTIINLVCRFYDPTEGAVLADGYDLRRLAQQAYRSHLAVVMQDTVVFSGTVLENIRYGKPDASFAEVQHVAREMGIAEMIAELPEGYETQVGERGATLSLGQKQLLAFARALIRQPRILVLDEASSYLDSQTEQVVQNAMERLSRGRTTFVIAHRLATIRDADRILVIQNGTIVENGSHSELLTKDGHYAQMLRTQFAVGV